MPARAAQTALEFSGLTVTTVSYEPSETVTRGQFTLRNDRAKPIIFVSVRCTVVDASGQMSEGTTTFNDVGLGQTVKKDVYFVQKPNNLQGSMTCVPYDLFE